jgi:hypothetical protein
MATKVSMNSLLTNRFVLYAMLFLSVLTIIGYIALSDYLAIGVFVLAGVIATYFTKNMILILGAAILAASALGVRGSVTRAVEGMTNGADGDAKAKKSPTDGDAAGADDAAAGADDAAAGADDAADADADVPAVDAASAPGTSKAAVAPAPNGKKNGAAKKQGFRAMANKIRPAKVSGSDELDDDEIIGKRIDYAATIEQAYDHLQSMLGDKGMTGLTSETERLIKQQKSLMETLSTMAPVLETAKDTLGSLNMTGLFGMGGGAAATAAKKAKPAAVSA